MRKPKLSSFTAAALVAGGLFLPTSANARESAVLVTAPTELVAERVHGCGLCAYRRTERVRPGADPGLCPHCNP